MLSDEIRELRNQAYDLLKENRLAEARVLFERICRISPENADAWMRIGAIDGELGQVDSGISHLKRAIDIEPDYAYALYLLARMQHSKRQPLEARNSLRKAVSSNSKYIEAWLMLAGIEEQLENYGEVEQCCRRLIELDSSIVDAFLYLGNALSILGKYEDAVAQYQIVLARSPELAAVWSRLAILQFNLGRLEESEMSLRYTLQIMPDDIQNNILLEKILLRRSKTDEAIELLQHILLLEPGIEHLWDDLITAISEKKQYQVLINFCDRVSGQYPNEAPPWFGHGYALQKTGQHGTALEYYKRAIELAPGWARVWVTMGSLHRETGNYKEAIYCFEKVLHCGIDNAFIHSDLGEMLRIIGFMDESEKHCRIAVEMAPDFAPVLICLGRVLTDRAKYEEAILVFEKALVLTPDETEPVAALSCIYERMGQYEKSQDLLQPLINRKDPPPGILNVYAAHASRLGNQIEIVDIIENALSGYSLEQLERMKLHFTAGRLYDSLSNPAKAMEHFNIANKLKRADFDLQAHVRLVEDVMAYFNQVRLSMPPRASNQSGKPVFIVGMPRSGTSLVEQILASHEDIYGAGELPDIDSFAEGLGIKPGGAAPIKACLSSLNSAELDTFADNYLNNLEKLSNGERIVVDKMPSNFLWLGLIQLLFPKARIIHTKRNPIDTCLSCYFLEFGGAHPYAYNFSHLGGYYKEYEKIMAHWQQTLSLPILDIDYKKLVYHTEEEAKRIIEFCGLEWDKRVLRFYESNRMVNTASYDQVRRPIYTSSIDRWKPYEPFINPLLSALNLLPDR